MSATPTAKTHSATAKLASERSLPPRVRRILEALFDQASIDLTERFGQMLVELEQQVFKQAERARSNEAQAEQMSNLHTLRSGRGDLLPMFLSGLEAELASIRRPRELPAEAEPARLQYQTLTLVEDAQMDQDIVLLEIARRHDTRAHTQLFLMGQRFGVLAGAPAFDAAQLPLGPQSLCNVLRTAVAAALQINLDTQLMLYKAFDLKVMVEYSSWIEVLNGLLARQGVLPGLIYAPQRARAEARAPGERGGSAHAGQGDATQPMTDWYGHSSPSSWSAFGDDADPRPPEADMASTLAALTSSIAADGHEPVGSNAAASFATLQQMLLGKRTAALLADAHSALLAKAKAGKNAVNAGPPIPLPTHDLLSGLRAMQSAPPVAAPGKRRRTMQDVQSAMLAQARRQHGPQAALVQEDADTFELLGMLYNEMEREVKQEAPAAEMLVRLQVPVAQAALHDREFFLRPRHPARELLNSVAESGAAWLSDEESDPQLVQKLNRAVDRVVAEYDGDEEIFETVNTEVQAHFSAMARKAEVTERRHVEAARGKDRLEIAKQRASDTIQQALQGQNPQKFVQALLSQAWADVLTLTLLRNGEDSEEWREQQQVTRRIAAASGDAGSRQTDESLTPKIEAALVQVGYHSDEASAIARRLSGTDDEDDAASRTELTARLKARARLGEQVATRKPTVAERNAEEQRCHDYLRTLPFGTWFEFTRNQQGDITRQRLSWYSPVTDNALFVNQRGQRIGEQSMDSLARLMALGQVHVVTQGKGRLIDRAWRATVKALRNITGAAADEGASA